MACSALYLQSQGKKRRRHMNWNGREEELLWHYDYYYNNIPKHDFLCRFLSLENVQQGVMMEEKRGWCV